jgi:hypothetical protein
VDVLAARHLLELTVPSPRSDRRKARFYINLALYAGALLTTSALALGVAVALTLIGKVRSDDWE